METQPEVSIDTDVVMSLTHELLKFDLRYFVPPSSDRRPVFVGSKYSHPYVIKCQHQVSDFLKRYRFSNDQYTDDELKDLTDRKYLDQQVRLVHHRTFRSDLVVRNARSICKQILGAYNEEDIFPYCRFSRNAVVGYPSERRFLDYKIGPNSTITGTAVEIEWFRKNYLHSDPILAMAVEGCTFDSISSLAQINVPKSYKIMRPVKPNTLIGSFRSYGLGKLIQSRLACAGLDITKLQQIHRDLARTASRRLHLATADLSSASDSFQPHLVNMLLPRKWYNALKLGRTPYYTLKSVKGEILYSPSFMAMGIGFTFPVQTLLFYSLLLSLQQLTGLHGRISVYGDDLIYPIRLHPYVEVLFSDLGFQLNKDKTFAEGLFRESCGGDFYDAVDVRPTMPQGVQRVLKGLPVLEFLYSVSNALSARWGRVELPNTFDFLEDLILKCSKALQTDIHWVPTSAPDGSGLHVHDDIWYMFPGSPLVKCLFRPILYHQVLKEDIYYWEVLQGNRDSNPYDGPAQRIKVIRQGKRKEFYQACVPRGAGLPRPSTLRTRA